MKWYAMLCMKVFLLCYFFFFFFFLLFYFCFFFFQAEDGIRDVAVTGVQTCALPIYGEQRVAQGALIAVARPGQLRCSLDDVLDGMLVVALEIGRASCRERV